MNHEESDKYIQVSHDKSPEIPSVILSRDFCSLITMHNNKILHRHLIMFHFDTKF